jgi:hypothetical protein
MHYPKMKHREWVKFVNIEDVVRLSKANKIPQSIEGFMLQTSCKHLLRCIYGSNLRAALALLGEALWGKIRWPYAYLNWLLHRKQWEDEDIAEELKEIEQEVGGGDAH